MVEREKNCRNTPNNRKAVLLNQIWIIRCHESFPSVQACPCCVPVLFFSEGTVWGIDEKFKMKGIFGGARLFDGNRKQFFGHEFDMTIFSFQTCKM
jgi:hypothetical protein